MSETASKRNQDRQDLAGGRSRSGSSSADPGEEGDEALSDAIRSYDSTSTSALSSSSVTSEPTSDDKKR